MTGTERPGGEKETEDETGHSLGDVKMPGRKQLCFVFC